MTRFASVAILVVAWLFLAAARITGPSDIYDKEQPRTIAYTADILVNHRVLLPHDTFDIPATKPPLYNWMSAPFVAEWGYQEWALKIPSLLASLAVLLTLILAARHIDEQGDFKAPGSQSYSHPSAHTALAVVSALFYLAAPMTAKLMYVARPDMLLAAFLLAAWLAATMMVESPRPRPMAQIIFWLATLGAALTKGPSALLAVLYLILAARLIAGKWSALKRSGWWWGVPLLLLVLGVAAAAAYQQEPVFFREILLGREMGGRIATPWQIFATLLNGPFYMVTRFLPWSLFALLLLFLIPLKKWFSFAGRPAHPLAPAILWVLIFLVTFSFMSTKRPDRYAPVFPAMALLAGYCLLNGSALFPRRKAAIAGPTETPGSDPWALRSHPRLIVLAALLMILGLAVHNEFFSDAAVTGYGDHAIAFAREVQSHTRGAPILFLDGELTPVETFLGQNQPAQLSAEALAHFHWTIRYDDPANPGRETPAAISDSLNDILPAGPGSLALYPLAPGQAAALYHQFQTTPRDYINNATSNAAHGPAANRWSQYYHEHPDRQSP